MLALPTYLDLAPSKRNLSADAGIHRDGFCYSPTNQRFIAITTPAHVNRFLHGLHTRCYLKCLLKYLWLFAMVCAIMAILWRHLGDGQIDWLWYKDGGSRDHKVLRFRIHGGSIYRMDFDWRYGQLVFKEEIDRSGNGLHARRRVGEGQLELFESWLQRKISV